jgi:hypothetical protein
VLAVGMKKVPGSCAPVCQIQTVAPFLSRQQLRIPNVIAFAIKAVFRFQNSGDYFNVNSQFL